MGMIETPYVNIFDTAGDDDTAVLDLPLGSDKRSINFEVSHVGFFLFNFINIAYLVVIEGYALRNLSKNFLHKLCLIGCACQLCSCITSLQRYNTNDEFDSFLGNGGTIFGNIGFACCSSAISVVWFRGSDNRNKWWTITSIFWLLVHNINSVHQYVKWDEARFSPFRPMVATAVVYQTITMAYCLIKIKKGDIVVNPAVASQDQFERVCQALIGLNILAFALTTQLGLPRQTMPILTYPQTGWIYSTCVVFCKFAGQMDFAKPSGRVGETSALLG